MTLLRDLIFSFLLLSAGADAFYGSSDVVELDNKNFDKEILRYNGAAVSISARVIY